MKTTTIKRWFSLLLALVMALSLCTTFAFAEGETLTATVDKTLKETLAQETAQLTNPEFGSEWVILGLARSGYLEKGSKYFSDYYSNVVSYVNKQAEKANGQGAPAGALHPVKCTENSRLIIALSAIGRDAAAVGNWDLVKPYENYDWISGQGLNSVIFALIALDTVNDPVSDTGIRQRCVNYILSRQLSDGGWAYQEDAKSADPDMTAMSLQALSRYTEQEKVADAVEAAVACLSAMQNSDGSYTSYEAVNSESISQVIVACTALDINPHTDSRFIKNGTSAVKALLSFYDSSAKAFRHVKDKDVDGMATEQAAYALTAYQRLVEEKPSLYDMSDVKVDCKDGEHEYGDWTETAASCTSEGFKMRTCAVCGRSEVVVTGKMTGHQYASGYEMSDAKHWFACVVCGAHLKETEHQYTGDQCTICGYHKLGGRIEITTLTAVPDGLKEVSGMSSVAKIRAKLLESAQKVDKDIKAADTRLLDVTLMIPTTVNNTTVWTPAAKENYPKNGRITVLLPYPDGTGMEGYDFVVTHMLATDDFGTAGSVESPKVKETVNGLQVTVTGLSPVLIGWKSSGALVNSQRTGDSSLMLLWMCGVALPAAAIVVLTQKKKRSAK